MVISDATATYFIHVPKCAGTSVKAALRTCGFTLTKLDTQMDDVRSGFYKRGTAARMLRHIDPTRWAQGFRFAVCRNPYERLLSGWTFCRQKEKLNVPFDYFVRNMGTYRDYFIEWHCVMTQLQHLVIDGVPAIDYVCRFERLDDDFEVIRKRLGHPDLRLPRLNQSSHAPYREHFTRELQDIAFERFAEDFEYFGYGYDL
jgi:hypothetical protein